MIGNFTDEQLRYCLKRIRSIAAMPEQEALEELSGFLWQLTYQPELPPDSELAGPDRDEPDNEPIDGQELIQDLEKAVNEIRKAAGRPHADSFVVGIEIDRCVEKLALVLEDPSVYGLDGHLLSRALTQRDELNKLKAKVEIESGSRWLKEACDHRISTRTSVNKILSDIERCVARINEYGELTSTQVDEIAKAKERCGRYRADRKLKDALVARSGGNEKKYLRLIAEAEELLRQDWLHVFGSEECPPLC